MAQPLALVLSGGGSKGAFQVGFMEELILNRGVDVGIVLNNAPVWAERPEAAEVADGVDAIRNRVWLGPLVDGAYDDGLLRVAPGGPIRPSW